MCLRSICILVVLDAFCISALASRSSLLLLQDFMVIGVNAVRFALIYQAPFIEQIVSILECYDFWLLLLIQGFATHCT